VIGNKRQRTGDPSRGKRSLDWPMRRRNAKQEEEDRPKKQIKKRLRRTTFV
jgi:hypothetical protein